MALENIVDLKKYPLLNLAENQHLFQLARAQFQNHGLVILPDFLRPQVTRELVEGCQQAKDSFFKQTVYGNPYLSKPDESFSNDHVVNRQDSTTVGILAYDQIAETNPLKKLYQYDQFLDLVALITGKPRIFRYRCPLGAINISLMEKSDHLRWHFDQADFVVSIPLQDSELGGKYQYVRNLRSETDPNYSGVTSVVNGTADSLEPMELQASPGSLVLFEGRHTLHRVTEVKGDQDRYVALFGFADKVGTTSTEFLRKIRYGRIG